MIKHAERRKVGEVAGGAAAECAAVWCCGPCAVVNLVVLAVYRVPAAVCKKACVMEQRRKEELNGFLYITLKDVTRLYISLR